MARNCNPRQGQRLLQGGINNDEALNRSFHQDFWILFQQVWPAAVGRYKIKIFLLDKIFANRIEQERAVSLAYFRRKDSPGNAGLVLTRTSYLFGAIIQFSDPLLVAFLGFLVDI